MILHALGHSELVVETADSSGRPYFLLSDAWLTRYSVGDFMERNPPVEIDWASFPKIDDVFISHSHADHLDPYFLTELSKRRGCRILLPETLGYLVPVFSAYLPNAPVVTLRNLERFEPRPGIGITGLVFENESVGNEEDVMTLMIEDGSDCAYLEVDTLPPEIPEEREKLRALLTDKPYRTVCYVATRNELEGNLKIHDLAVPNERKKFAKQYVEDRTEWMEWQYAMFDEYGEDLEDFTKIRNFCRVFTGQGLRYPSGIDPMLAAVNLLPLPKILEIERELAKKYGRNIPQDFLEAGISYRVAKGKTERIGKVPGVTVVGGLPEIRDVSALPAVKRSFRPMREDDRQLLEQEKLVLGLLNGRFLPTKLADPDDNLKNAVLRNPDRNYRILVRYGNSRSYVSKTYVWNFSMLGFDVE